MVGLWMIRPLITRVMKRLSGLEHLLVFTAELDLTHILDLHLAAVPRTKIRPQRPSKQLLQHLKADTTQRCIIPSLA